MTPQWVSGRLLEILDYSGGKFPGKVTDVIVADSETQRRQQATESLGVSIPKTGVYRLKTRSGKVISVRLQLVGVEVDGTPYEVGKVVEIVKK